jgi:hypothetical protein
MTPSAAYCAPVSSAADSTIRCRTASIESSEVTAMAASRTARNRSWSVCGMAAGSYAEDLESRRSSARTSLASSAVTEDIQIQILSAAR